MFNFFWVLNKLECCDCQSSSQESQGSTSSSSIVNKKASVKLSLDLKTSVSQPTALL